MPRVGFEPTIPAFERAKTVHALDSTATVIGSNSRQVIRISNLLVLKLQAMGRESNRTVVGSCTHLRDQQTR
jgi:hypothetical protein